ncbi:DUF892 family protein [bacterium]|nr:DUF892 family protein [bacterium]
MKINTLKELYLFGIQDMHDGCGKSFDAMQAMQAVASHDGLRRLTQEALKAMHQAMGIFAGVLSNHGVAAIATGNKALKALSDEANDLAVEAEFATPMLRDLAIVSKIRNIAHYPEAGFKTFIAQAEALGFEDDLRLLRGDGADTIDNALAFRLMADIEIEIFRQI